MIVKMYDFSIVGIDIGNTRVGVAVCETASRNAVPFAVFNRAKGKAEAQLIQLIATNGTQLLVVGLPLDEDGDETEQSLITRNFCRRLTQRVQVEIQFIDEYDSSQEAIEWIKGQRIRLSPKELLTLRRSGEIDKHAAAIILKRYLDRAR